MHNELKKYFPELNAGLMMCSLKLYDDFQRTTIEHFFYVQSRDENVIVGFCLPEGTTDLVTSDLETKSFTLEKGTEHSFAPSFSELQSDGQYNLFYDRVYDVIYRKYNEVSVK